MDDPLLDFLKGVYFAKLFFCFAKMHNLIDKKKRLNNIENNMLTSSVEYEMERNCEACIDFVCLIDVSEDAVID